MSQHGNPLLEVLKFGPTVSHEYAVDIITLKNKICHAKDDGNKIVSLCYNLDRAPYP